MEKESISALEFIHADSIGDIEKCKFESKAIYQWLESEYKADKIEGIEVYVIRNTKTIEEQFLLIQYKKITNDVFPFLYVSIQPYNNDLITYYETTMSSNGYTKVDPLDNWEQAGDLYNN